MEEKKEETILAEKDKQSFCAECGEFGTSLCYGCVNETIESTLIL